MLSGLLKKKNWSKKLEKMVEIIKAHYHTRISELSYYKKESSLASLTNHFPNIAELRIHFFGKHLSINVFHGSTIWKIYFPPSQIY